MRTLLVLIVFFVTLFSEDTCQIDENLTYQDCRQYISISNSDTFNTQIIPPPTAFKSAKSTSLGYQLYPVWTQLFLHNSGSKLNEVLLVNPRAGMDKINVHVYKNDHLIFKDTVGDMVPIQEKLFKHRYAVIHLKIEPNETIRIVSRISNYAIVESSWIVLSPPLFQKINENDMLVWGFYYGLILAIILYSINSYLILKNKVFIFYVLIAISSSSQVSSFNGIAYELSPFLAFNNYLLWLFMPFTVIFMLLFSKHFFNTSSTMPTMNKIINLNIFIVSIIAIVMSLGYFYLQTNETMFVIKKYLALAILIYAIPTLIGLNAIKLKLKGAVFYTIGQGFYALAIGYQVFYNYHGSVFSLTTLYAILCGSLIDLIFLSFALGQFFRFIKSEKERNEKLLIAQSSFSNIGKSLGHITHQWRHPIAQIGTSLMLLESIYRHQSKNLTQIFATQLPEMKNNLHILESTLNNFSSAFQIQESDNYFSPQHSISQVEHLLKSKIVLKNVHIELNIENDLSLFGNENIFFNIIMILMDNSIDAFEKKSKNIISITIESNNNRIKIHFLDNAGGIKIQPLSDIFEYYVTSKNDGEMHGFGLPMIKLLVEDKLQGQIEVKSTLEGTLFYISYPSAKEN